MTVGTLARRYGVTLVHQSKAADTADLMGGRVETWTDGVPRMALMQVQAVSEGPEGGAERRVRNVKVYFESVVAIGIGDRLKHGSVIYEVRSVRNPDERPGSDRLAYTIVEASEVHG